MSTSHHAKIFLQARSGAGPYCAEMHYRKLATGLSLEGASHLYTPEKGKVI